MASNEIEEATPDRWNDIDPLIIPFFETPSEWFQEPGNQYETVFGPFSGISHLTPEMVRFRAAVRRDQYPNIDQSIPSEGTLINVMGDPVEQDVRGVEAVDQAVVGEHGESPIDTETPVVWLERGPTILTVYEQIPFGEDGRVTTPGELRSTLNEIMSNTPDWGELFEAASDVAGFDSIYN
jgi:hypothetical protein